MFRYAKNKIGDDRVKGNFVPQDDEQFRFDCYKDKVTDVAAAEKCNISKYSFYGWRTRRGYPVISGGRWGKNV